MRPKFIFSAVFAVSSILIFYLPQLGTPAATSTSRAARNPAVMSVQAAVAAPPPAIASSAGASSAVANPAASSPDAIVENQPAPALNIPASALQSLPGLQDFATKIVNNQPGLLVGVYVPGLFALPVIQQPGGNNDFVSPEDSTLTQYGAASNYGSIGILAHNLLSGQAFFGLSVGQEVMLVYGDGQMVRYQIDNIEQFQALSPDNPYSDFIDLNDPFAKVQPFTDVFNRFYSTPGQVVFQTCIDANGNPNWGRIFVVAKPIP